MWQVGQAYRTARTHVDHVHHASSLWSVPSARHQSPRLVLSSTSACAKENTITCLLSPNPFLRYHKLKRY